MSDDLEAAEVAVDELDRAREAAAAEKKPGSALATIKIIVPAVAFAKGGIEKLVSDVEVEARALAAKLDISTEQGRKAIASLAYKVAQSKTGLDTAGKNLNAAAQTQINAINEDRRMLRDRLDALKDEVRAPLTRWEAADEARIKAHEAAIADIEALAITEGLTADEINTRIWFSDGQEGAWQEFEARAERAIATTLETLRAAHAVALVREAEAAEKARLDALEIERIDAENERKRLEREAQIEADARAKAEMEAEAKAEAARVAAARALAAAEARTAKAEQDRLAAERKAAQDAQDAAVRAEQRAQAAVEQERAQVAADAAEAKRQDDLRAADEVHRASVHREVLAGLMALAIAKVDARLLLEAIVRGAIPHLAIQY